MTAVRRKFTCVDVDFGEDETRNFGRRNEFSAPTSLYEIHTIATITEEENDENLSPETEETAVEYKNPFVRCCNTDEFIAVAELSEKKFCGKTAFSIKPCCSDYYISVVNGQTCYTVCLLDLQNALAVYNEPKETKGILEQLQKTRVDIVQFDDSLISDLTILPLMSSNLLLPGKSNENILLTEIGGSKKLISHLPLEGHCGFVRARECSTSGLLLLLAEDGTFFILDLITCVIVVEKKILPSEFRPIDFVIIDCELAELSASTKVAFLVEHENTVQLQVRHFGDGGLLYSVVVNNNSLLLNTSSKEDGTVFLTEFVDSKQRTDASIRLRSVSECQPDMRLQRMLIRCQFDEAEQLANLFGLDLQKVYVARANYLLSCLDSDVEDQGLFDAFIACLDKIEDNNWVGESCTAGATLCRSFNWIVSILRYAETRNITDPETKESLCRLRYNLSTYRMLFGPEKASFDRESAWNDFVSDDNWKELFLSFCKEGCGTEARLLWNRYNCVLKPWMQDSFAAFSSFVDILTSKEKYPVELFELAEHELLPVALYAHPNELSETFFDWILSFGNKLEVLHPIEFPENALDVCSIMERTANAMIASAITPLQQAQLAHSLAVIHIDSENEEYPMGRLNVYVKDLREMVKLKKKYECCLSHKLYKEQTKESICHLILSRAKNVQLVSPNIKQFAVPYMEEYRLDVDQTLFNYILELSRISSDVAANLNYWDGRCLAVAENIGSRALRCRAVISIAKRAHPPWVQQLRDTVDLMMNDANVDSSLKVELRKLCDLAQLGQVLIPYSIPFSCVEALISGSRYVTSLISFMLRQEQVERNLEKRTIDSLKVVQIVEKLKPGILSKEVCLLQCCNYIISTFEEKDMFCTLNRFINALNESDRKEVVERLVMNVLDKLDDAADILTLEEQHLRMVRINAALCVLSRFSNEVLEFAELLTIHPERACVIAVNCCVDQKESLLAIYYAKSGLRGSIKVGKELLDASMLCYMFGLWNLHDLAVNNCLDDLLVLAEALTDLTPLLVEAVGFKVVLHYPLLIVATYINLFLLVLEQCKISDGEKVTSAGRVRSIVIEQNTEKSEIYGMNHRLGIYRPSSDGAIFEKGDAVRAVAFVARSVLEQGSKSSNELAEFYEEMRNNWDSLFSFLSLNNQPFLELCCRSFSTFLPCFKDQVSIQFDMMSNSLRTLSERVLLQYPSDLCLVSSALFTVTLETAKKTLLDLRNWAKSRKTPQLMLNLIRVSRFICILYGDRSAIEQMTQYYIICIWTRRMGKLKASMPNDLAIKSVVQEFVKAQVPVNELLDFCSDFGLDKCEAVLQYALRTAELCSIQKDDNIAEEMFRLASNAFQILTVTEDIFLRLYDSLMLLCSYNYRVIQLYITEMKKRVKEDEECQIMLIQRLCTLYSFLTVTQRVNAPTESELRWYQERQKCIEQKELLAASTFFTTVESASTTLNCTGVVGTGDSEPFAEGLYEKPSIVLSSLPPLSRSRLPFHVFLFEDEKDIKNILLPIINAELTLFTVNSWQRLARSLPHLSLSRSRLLSGTVMVVIKRHIQNGTTITDDEISSIQTLLYNTSNQMAIVADLSQGFKSIPLCETKIRLLEIGINISEMWLQSSELQHPLSDDARSYVECWLKKLIPSLKLFKTEYLLQKASLLKRETVDMVKSAEQLVVYIYSNEINWSDSRDKEEKLDLINKIAEIHSLDLVTIQAKVLEAWLPGSSSEKLNFDLNDTDGEVAMKEVDENEGVLRLPYLDISLTSGSIERLLYGRLIEVSGIDLHLKTFLDKDKPALVRSLLSSNYRQTSQLAYLVSCMVVDYRVYDRSVVEVLLGRLHASRNREMLIGLLRFCRDHKDLTTVRNLAHLWARTADWMACDIDLSSPAAKALIHKFLNFCLSCPVEGGRAFGTLFTTIDGLQLPLSSQLIRVAASATSPCIQKTQLGNGKSALDICLEWEKSE
ncbi:unnamed protein product [Enterobius vermicularis]|uniref:Rod_C domain-containing protein n=1 Tax=Enterobius vermicularis TaxID=51028 RepID=A0A0N4VDJ2_ENTVE|nr:unnamed protein product [Enterobius vermicularis]